MNSRGEVRPGKVSRAGQNSSGRAGPTTTVIRDERVQLCRSHGWGFSGICD